MKRIRDGPELQQEKAGNAEMMVIELRNRLQVFSQLCWLILEQELWEAMRFCRITAVCLSLIPKTGTKFWQVGSEF